MTDIRHDPAAPLPPDRATELGYAPMDKIHAEFDDLLAGASQANAGNWLESLVAIDAHLREHFEAEDRWMRESDFPPSECHIEEHAAVLQSSSGVLALARQGDFRAAPSFVAELSRWFPGHAAYLDSALAAWLCKRKYGGKPVVVHRSVKAA